MRCQTPERVADTLPYSYDANGPQRSNSQLPNSNAPVDRPQSIQQRALSVSLALLAATDRSIHPSEFSISFRPDRLNEQGRGPERRREGPDGRTRHVRTHIHIATTPGPPSGTGEEGEASVRPSAPVAAKQEQHAISVQSQWQPAAHGPDRGGRRGQCPRCVLSCACCCLLHATRHAPTVPHTTTTNPPPQKNDPNQIPYTHTQPPSS